MSPRKSETFPRPLGFNAARRRAVFALLGGGLIQHEPRSADDDKNLLSGRVVSQEFVAFLLGRCNGSQYSSSLHHVDRSTEVHIFRPVVLAGNQKQRWYIKLYFREHTVFISVHISQDFFGSTD